MGIIIALLIFGIIVTVHEFGHFICAKLSGVRVLEFSIGMGPKLLQKQKGETKYSLRLLPVGGYCAMEGEDESGDDPRSFRSQKLWKRMIVLAAGAFMNFILGIITLAIMVSMMDSVPTRNVYKFAAIEKTDGSLEIAAKSYEGGLRHGDKIIKIDNNHIFSILDINYIFDTAKTDTHDITVIRSGKKVELEDVQFGTPEGSGRDFVIRYDDKGVVSIARGSGQIFMSMTHMVGLSLKQLVSGKMHKDEVSGPVGVVSAISETAKESRSTLDAIFNLLYLTSLITINVGVFNLLPIPGLDGGRLLFCFIELIRRKPVKPEHEGYVHLAGMMLLFGLMIFATYNDIVRLVTGG